MMKIHHELRGQQKKTTKQKAGAICAIFDTATVKKILRLEIAFWEVARGGAGAQHRLGEALIGRFRGFWFASLSFLLLLLLLLSLY